MTNTTIARQRLHNQQLTHTAFAQPEQVVQWLGAVQAQDYGAAKWALALRAHNLTDAAIDRAFDAGTILRTHVMRPTWHFVTPADIGWLLALTAPRIKASTAASYRRFELDEAVIGRSQSLLEQALHGGKHLTRPELGRILQQAGIATDDPGRLGRILFRAELDGLVCSGPRRGKQFTYALLAERAPHGRPLRRDEALAELTRRYFTSHGPATMKDYIWWSGLSAADAQAGLDLIKPQLSQDVVDGQTYWLVATPPPASGSASIVHLLPNYDEYLVGYTDRSAAFDAPRTPAANTRDNILFSHTIAIDGLIIGIWRRMLRPHAVTIESTLFAPLTDDQHSAVAVAVQQYGAFLELPAALA